MFIVARRKGQRIVIGNDIEIIVTELSRTTVKLGILAPKPYSILRGEIRDNVEEANREALQAALAADGTEPKETSDLVTLDAHLSGATGFLGKPVKPVAPGDVKPETLPR
ncbi:MAG TPA: carbon storage regulator [Polyangiaceae bacterium]